MKAAVDEGTFITVWHETGGSAAEVARRLGVAERNVHARRSRIEAKKGIVLASRDNRTNRPRVAPPGRMTHDLQNGTVLVGSDAHVWPSGELTTAQRGFIHLAKTLKPDVIVLNGWGMFEAVLDDSIAIGSGGTAAMSGSRAVSSRVTRVRRVPSVNASTR